MIPDSVRKYVYHEEPDIVLLHGPCLEILPLLEPESVDLIITDPPYEATSCSWDKHVSGWTLMLKDLLKKHGSMWCFGSMRYFLREVNEFCHWSLAQEVIWEKHNGSNLHNDRFRRVHEIIVHFYPKDSLWLDVQKNPQFTHDANARTVRRKRKPQHLRKLRDENSFYSSVDGGPRLMRSIFKVPSCHGYAEHPTQKPVELLLPLIQYSSIESAVLIDPFGGSGTTAVAAKKLGRKCIVIEIESTYLDITVDRLRQGVMV